MATIKIHPIGTLGVHPGGLNLRFQLIQLGSMRIPTMVLTPTPIQASVPLNILCRQTFRLQLTAM